MMMSEQESFSHLKKTSLKWHQFNSNIHAQLWELGCHKGAPTALLAGFGFYSDISHKMWKPKQSIALNR